jgi:peptide/nickel transport system substrate-binding protein
MESTNERTRMPRLARLLPFMVAAVAGLVVAGCGSSSTSSSTSSTHKSGGTVTVLDVAGGVDSLDPGFWYYQTDYTELGQTTQRWLYGWKDDTTSPTPDIATALPAVSNGGKTLTIHIHTGIHYSPPLQKQTVTSADIKYALERCFLANVGSDNYVSSYYNNIVGAPTGHVTKLPNITGLQTPNPTTLVINTTVPVGVLADANALGLPCTIPVPQNYAAKYDVGAQSSYGMHAVFTGPYMIKGAGTGTVPTSSYQPGKLLQLVRNPSWVASTDPIRHAYFDAIDFKGGNDVTVASNQIIDGSNLMSGDFAAPPPAILKTLVQQDPSQVHISSSGGNRYITLNTTIPPLNNVNVRRAIAAVIDKNALRLTRGGVTIGVIATHFIPPGIPGFDQAGGNTGPGYDFDTNPNGDLAVAESYMKKAGYKSGKYTGPAILTIADNSAPASNTALAVESELQTLGFKLTFREVPHATMLTKFCEVATAKVAICPNTGWGKDFYDAQSMIDPVFNGAALGPATTNMSQVNNPALNTQIDAAKQLTDPTARAAAWGKLDGEITSDAYVVPWLWDNEVSFSSKNVNGAVWMFNGGDWDLTNSSLK